jgi:hypothetical protein
MREIFKPQPDEPADPGRVFYTITAEDVGCRVIVTDIGPIIVGDFIGAIQPADVGRRLYRVPVPDTSQWVWQCESDDHRFRRQMREISQEITATTGRPPRH